MPIANGGLGIRKLTTFNKALLGKWCKVEFNQPFCWLCSMSNFLVIQHLETLYLGKNYTRVVCERV